MCSCTEFLWNIYVKPHHKDDISCSTACMDRIALAYKLHTYKQVLFFGIFCLVG